MKPNTAGPGRHRGGSGYECLRLRWKTPFYEMQNIGHGGVHPVRPVGRLSGRDRLPPQRAQHEPVELAAGARSRSGRDPGNELAPQVNGDTSSTSGPRRCRRPCARATSTCAMFRGGAGLGDPLERAQRPSSRTSPAGTCRPASRTSTGWSWMPRESRRRRGDRGPQRQDLPRQTREVESVPVSKWMEKERRRAPPPDRDQGRRPLILPVRRMYAESMRLSPQWAEQFRAFWGPYPADYGFDAATPTVDVSERILAGQGTRRSSSASRAPTSTFGPPGPPAPSEHRRSHRDAGDATARWSTARCRTPRSVPCSRGTRIRSASTPGSSFASSAGPSPRTACCCR